MIKGFFWVENVHSGIFLGWLGLSRDFLGVFKTILRFVLVPVYPWQLVSVKFAMKMTAKWHDMIIICFTSVNAFWTFLRLGNLAWNFLVDNFWSRDFLGFRFLSRVDHPHHLKSGVTPPPSPPLLLG